MSGILQTLFLGAAAAVKDAYFNLVTLLLNTTATNGAQNNTFLDSSTNNFSITRNGNTTQGTFTPFSQTGWSNYFNGSSTYLSLGNNSAFDGDTTFCAECWIYPTYSSGSDKTPFGGNWTYSSGGWDFISSANNNIIFRWCNGSYNDTGAQSVNPNAWNHIATSISGGRLSFYVNGTRVFTTTSGTNIGAGSNGTYIGWNGGNNVYEGYVSNARIVRGATPYDPTLTTLTVPTAPLTAISGTTLLTSQSNRFKDNSTNNFALTATGTPSVQAFSPFDPTTAYDAAVVGGSGYFDGATDYLSVADNAAFSMGTGNFTAEFWVYTADQTTNYPGIISGSLYTDTGVISIRYDVTGQLNKVFIFLQGASPADPAITSSVYGYGQWLHVAVIRDSLTSLKLYVNGVLDGTATILLTQTVDFSGANSFYVGRGFDIDGAQAYYTGYITNVRLIKGQALASGNFTPPSAPVTGSSVGWTGANAAASITGTVSFIMSATNAGIFDSASKKNLETVGTAQVSTTQAKWGTTSMYFAGSGNYLLTPYSPTLVFGTADFTFECQLYWTGGNSENNLIMNNASGGFNVKLQAATATNWALENAYVGQVADFGTAPTQNTWHHIAITRASGTLYAFIDGTQVYSGANSTNFVNTASWYVAGNGASASLYITGYIDDLRITTGYARYTASFTPPTAAFPLQ